MRSRPVRVLPACEGAARTLETPRFNPLFSLSLRGITHAVWRPHPGAEQQSVVTWTRFGTGHLCTAPQYVRPSNEMLILSVEIRLCSVITLVK